MKQAFFNMVFQNGTTPTVLYGFMDVEKGFFGGLNIGKDYIVMSPWYLKKGIVT